MFGSNYNKVEDIKVEKYEDNKTGIMMKPLDLWTEALNPGFLCSSRSEMMFLIIIKLIIPIPKFNVKQLISLITFSPSHYTKITTIK